MQKIMIIGEDLKYCKKLKYDLQDKTLQCYYATNMVEGLKHLLRYTYRLWFMKVLLPKRTFSTK